MAMLVITKGYSPFCPLSHRHLFSEDTAGMVFCVGWVDTGWTRRFELLKQSSCHPNWDIMGWAFMGFLGIIGIYHSYILGYPNWDDINDI